MELEHWIVGILGFLFGGLSVAFLWMRSPDFADAERYRWLKATTKTCTNDAGERIDVRNMPEAWDAAIDKQRAQAQEVEA
ncbi:hypothetical protein [Comamonas sp. lk]|uniref:hypothetical protein n=1 Tax=Comamonas sp. lk TaxID=2201272 RepID=UPI0013CF05C8|nr:hypothetical protein [Comamonas sp. lk]